MATKRALISVSDKTNLEQLVKVRPNVSRTARLAVEAQCSMHWHKAFHAACLMTHVQGLAAQGWEIISTGGTATTIQQWGVACKKVEDVTGFPEMLDGVCLASHNMGMHRSHAKASCHTMLGLHQARVETT